MGRAERAAMQRERRLNQRSAQVARQQEQQHHRQYNEMVRPLRNQAHAEARAALARLAKADYPGSTLIHVPWFKWRGWKGRNIRKAGWVIHQVPYSHSIKGSEHTGVDNVYLLSDGRFFMPYYYGPTVTRDIADISTDPSSLRRIIAALQGLG